MTPEEKVLKYLEKHSNKPLVFEESIEEKCPCGCGAILSYNAKLKPLPDDINNVSEMVYYVLDSSQRMRSLYYGQKRVQCRNSANRSALDVWRHIILFNPKIDLFSVMRALYEDSSSVYTRQYCGVVRKRVFHLDDSPGDYDDERRDEFGLVWSDWNAIGKEK